VGMKIAIHVHLTSKSAPAEVVYVDTEEPMRCGIAACDTTEHLGCFRHDSLERPHMGRLWQIG
jgi:hypothetical protein